MAGSALDPLRQHVDDVTWLTGQLARSVRVSALPVRAQVALIYRRARREARRAAIPAAVRDNLTAVFGATLDLPEVERIAREFVEFSRRKTLMLSLPNHLRFQTSKCWEMTGRYHLDEALGNGRGTIIVTGHFGYGRLIAPALESQGYEVLTIRAMGDPGTRSNHRHGSGVAKPVKLLDRRLREVKAGLDIRPMLATLARNGIVVLAGDGLKSSEFVRLRLLGKDYPFPTGFVKIAALSGAALLPSFAEPREGWPVCRIRVLPRLQHDSGTSTEAVVAAFADIYDREVGSAPHLWYRWGIGDVFRRAVEWSQSDQRWSEGFSGWCSELDRVQAAPK